MQTEIEKLLKSHDLSLTSVRLAVLEVLQHHPHSDADIIYQHVKEEIATQAIYNNLSALVEKGILREIKPKGSSSLYETRVNDNHHHLICRECQSVTDVACKSDAPCLHVDDQHGYEIDEAEIVFWGTCPTCSSLSNNKKGVHA
jgi:Fur family ferric uptake transcriptional regulator